MSAERTAPAGSSEIKIDSDSEPSVSTRLLEDGGRRELYNLRDDPYENRDLSAQLPEKTATLYVALQRCQRETGAAIPSQANPKYDPRAERPRGAQPNAGKKKPPIKK